jgi:hypothetical protein
MLRPGISCLLSFTAVTALFLAGCSPNPPAEIVRATPGATGAIHGGQQPISGATIQLYAVGTSGDGSPSTPLLTAPVTSDANGNFNVTGLYTCPTASTLVYITGTGGSPAASISNPQIALMAVLGTCGSLSASTFVNINELTTVAAVYSLAPYISSFSSIGSGTSDATAFAQYFAAAGEIVNTSTGTAPGTGLPANYSVPIAQVNTIGDLLAACINSPGGVSGDTSVCGQFFALTLPSGGTVPTDTIRALLNLANNPTLSTAALYNLIPPASPFQPTDTIVPPDFALRLIVNSLFTISPSSMTFAPTVVGASQAVQFVTVTNGTAAAVQITSVSTTGVNAADFTPLPWNIHDCAVTVPANSTCTIAVSFTPTAPGSRAAYFVLGNSSANPSLAIPLSGTGVAGQVTLTPTSANFPTTNTGSTSSIVFTLANAANTAYSITSYSTGNTAFTLTFNCPGLSIPAGGTCTVTATFTPSVAGPQSGTLAIQYYDGSVYPTVSSPLSALGTAPTLQFASSSLTFPATAVGAAAQSQTVALYNYGTGPASNLAASFSGASASSFAQTNNCPATLAVNASCNFTVTAAPTQTGSNTATLTVSTAGGSGALNTSVTGTAGNPTNNALVLSDTQFYVPSGGSTVLTLTNSGTSSFAFAEINPSTGFSQTNTCGTTLAAGATCNVQIFAAAVPTYSNVTTGTLTISSNAQTLVQTVPLYTANATNLYDFGSATVGYPAAGLFSTSCSSNCTVNTTVAGPNPGDFPYASGPNGCTGRGGCTVYNQFVPTATGRRIATSTYYFATTLLVGTGIPATGNVTSFSISAASIDFGTFYIGYNPPQPVTVTLTNTGNQPVPINSISTTSHFFQGYQFPETNTCGSSLAVGSTCTITVSFAIGSNGATAYDGGDLLINTYSTTPSIDIPLGAHPIQPQLGFQFSTTNVTLAQTQAGTPSTAQTVTLTNQGNVPITVTTGPYSSGGTVFTYATNCSTVAVGGNCTITINGTPPSVGTFSGVLPVAVYSAIFGGGLTQNISVSVTGN